jgi:hypothetical protein
MLRTILIIAIFVLSLGSYSLGQTARQPDPPNNPVMAVPDADLLPPGKDAWVIHLFTAGGLTGKGLPAVTAVSDGSYACGDIVPANFQRLPDDKLKILDDMIVPASLKPDKLMEKSDPGPPIVCSDCYQIGLVLTRRDSDSKVRTYTDSGKFLKYKPIAQRLGEIKKAFGDLTLCK